MILKYLLYFALSRIFLAPIWHMQIARIMLVLLVNIKFWKGSLNTSDVLA